MILKTENCLQNLSESVARQKTMLSEAATVHDFMSKNLITCSSNSNVSRAVKLMVDYNIGSVIVKDHDDPIGIFTERDLLSNVLVHHRRLEEPILTEVMTRSFNELPLEATLTDAAKIMTEKRGRLVVFENRTPIGIVTVTNLLKEIYRSGRTFDFNNIYSRRVHEVSPRSTVESVVQLMDQKRIGSVLVSEGTFSRGIFTERNLLRSVLSLDFRMDERVENFATHHLITAEDGIDGRKAVELMTSYRIKRLPLKRADQISGIVTARDLVDGFANSSW